MLFYVLFVLCRSLYCLCVYIYTELLPPAGYPVAVKYIISYHNEHCHAVFTQRPFECILSEGTRYLEWSLNVTFMAKNSYQF
jgi:hypothetical protein